MDRITILSSFRICLGLALVLLCAPSAHAYQFTPTDAEWRQWPGYCKAKYAGTNIGRRSKFARMAQPADKVELQTWEAAGINGVHHYCAGMLYLQRARFEKDDYRKQRMLRNALGETDFTLAASTGSSPLFVHVALQMAMIQYEVGNTQEALVLLDSIIASQPGNDMAYSAAAIMRRNLGQLDEAKAILLRGYEATGGASAELTYNLGLVLFELGEVDDAETYAVQAYELGYPLPGLRNKLRKVGRMQ